MQQIWLVTVPNGKDSSETTCETLKLNVPHCQIYRFQIPNLVVGTLDSLISLSDDLSKINGLVEVY
jgi:V-type H+-transporting ATPase subunit C